MLNVIVYFVVITLQTLLLIFDAVLLVFR